MTFVTIEATYKSFFLLFFIKKDNKIDHHTYVSFSFCTGEITIQGRCG